MKAALAARKSERKGKGNGPRQLSYSLDRRDKKLAGVCSTLGETFNIDPTFIRIGFVAAAILVSWKLALIAYIGAGIYMHIQKQGGRRIRATARSATSIAWKTSTRVRPTVHALRTAAGRDRPPPDGDRRPHQLNQRRAGARNRSAAGGEVMEPLTIGILAGGIFAGLDRSEPRGAQGMAGLARAEALRTDPRHGRPDASARRRPDRDRRP